MAVYLPLCQQYTTLFCTQEANPDKYTDPVYQTELSDRLHRVALQQAAGIAKSWRTNRQAAYETYLKDLADYTEVKAKARAEGRELDRKRKEPAWREWKLPTLRVPAIQANANVVVVEPSTNSTFDYWLRISTLDKGNPLRVPIKLASYHKQILADKMLNTSTTLHQRKGVWWLTLSFDEEIPLKTEAGAPVIGVDVGIANFVTTSTGQSYGTFHGALARNHRRDRHKRRNKAKLRACLQKKGVPQERLPSTSSATGQRRSEGWQPTRSIQHTVRRSAPAATLSPEPIGLIRRPSAVSCAATRRMLTTRPPWSWHHAGPITPWPPARPKRP
jgi:transposase